MIVRNNAQRDCMVIGDWPLEKEERRGLAWSEPSSTTFKDALGRASHKECAKQEEKYILNSTNICYTYLSLSRYADGDFDWATSVVNKKNIPEGETYHQIAHLKDVWVSDTVQIAINSIVKQIRSVQPKLILVTGKWAFMFLCSLYTDPSAQLATIAVTKSKPTSKKMFGGLNKFRSSILTLHSALELPPTVVIPLLTPAYLFLVKDKDFVVNRDYAKVAFIYNKLCSGRPVESFLQSNRVALIGDTKQKVMDYLAELYTIVDAQPTLVSMDVETRHGYKDCIGIAYEEYRSLTIPLSEMYLEENTDAHTMAWTTTKGKEQLLPAPIGAVLTKYRRFWSLNDEVDIMHLLWAIMLHKNCRHVGQNYNYDCQYYFHQWKLKIFSFCDTMILHHVLHNTLQKDLAMLASIYCMDFVYWKDEIDIKDNVTRWIYNGKDCQYTLSIAKVLLRIIERYPETLQQFYLFQQHKLNKCVVTVMNRGVLVDNELKEQLLEQFTLLMQGCLDKINYIFNEEVNLNSTVQVKRAFKELLGIKPIINKKTKAESFGSDAMLEYLELYPQWRTLLTLFLEYKSIKVFVKTFLSAKLDVDGKMRCDYNPAATKTYRLGSRKNVFGYGMNLANIPSKGKIDLRYSLLELANDDEDVETSSTEEIADANFGVMQFQTPVATIYTGKVTLPNCKRMFIPDSAARIFWDADYSAGDLHFVGWDADCAFIKNALRSGKCVYALLASEYYQREITKKDAERQIFKAVCHACVTGDHEVLTTSGWVKIEDIQDDVAIAVWNHKTHKIHFEIPTAYNRDFVDANEPLFSIEGAAYSQLTTLDHTFPYTTDLPDKIRSTQAQHLPKSARLPYSGKYVGGTMQVDNLAYMQLIAALQADGHVQHVALDGTATYRFRFVKGRKIDRLVNILNELNIQYDITSYEEKSAVNDKPRINIFFRLDKNAFIQPTMKKLGWEILNYNIPALTTWFNELVHWDGHVRKSNGVRTSISTTDKVASEVIQTVAHLLGYASKVQITDIGGNRRLCYEVSINNRNFHNMSNGTSSTVAHTGTKVYCPSTSTGFFMVRRNGNVMITGNTNYLGRENTISAKAHLKVSVIKKIIEMYFRWCPEIPDWHKRLESEARSKGYIENIWGARNEVWDFTDPMWMNKLVAWLPQSSLAILVNRAWVALEEAEAALVYGKYDIDEKTGIALPKEQSIITNLQTHDSLSGQFFANDVTAVKRIKSYMEQVVPYADKLVIPSDVKISIKSYGDCDALPEDSIYLLN